MDITNCLRVINKMQSDGIIGQYAIGGAVGALFYLEPKHTEDIDIFILFGNTSLILDLSPIFSYLKNLGYSDFRKDGLIVENWPVQFLPGDDPFLTEAIKAAREVQIEPGLNTWVLQAEYLVLAALRLGGNKYFARIDEFMTQKAVDLDKLQELISKYSLEKKWERYQKSRETGDSDK